MRVTHVWVLCAEDPDEFWYSKAAGHVHITYEHLRQSDLDRKIPFSQISRDSKFRFTLKWKAPENMKRKSFGIPPAENPDSEK